VSGRGVALTPRTAPPLPASSRCCGQVAGEVDGVTWAELKGESAGGAGQRASSPQPGSVSPRHRASSPPPGAALPPPRRASPQASAKWELELPVAGGVASAVRLRGAAGAASLAAATKFLQSLGVLRAFFDVDRQFLPQGAAGGGGAAAARGADGGGRRGGAVYIELAWMLDVVAGLAVLDRTPWIDFFSQASRHAIHHRN
jgi:hypothetical protein